MLEATGVPRGRCRGPVSRPVDMASHRWHRPRMNLTVHLPDDLATRLSADGTDLSRRALEAFAAEEYRSGRLNKPDLRRLLGIETRYALDGFLKAHGIDESMTLEELEQDLRDLDRIGL
jgi:hypothetical protein